MYDGSNREAVAAAESPIPNEIYDFVFSPLPGENGKEGKMNFDIFVNEVMRALQMHLGEGYEIRRISVVKNNNIRLTGITLMKMPGNVAPTIYLNNLYRDYEEGLCMQDIVSEILVLYKDQIREMHLNLDFFNDFGQVKGRIFHKLVHYDKNKEQLKEQPYIRWHDLAITFYYAMEENMLGKASIAVRNDHIRQWRQTAETLFTAAQENMAEKMPELLVPMQKLLEEMTGLNTQDEYSVPMYVLTNQEKTFGASALLYSKKIKYLAKIWQKDLLILPSSVHEVLILPDDGERDYDFYRQMVKEVNTTQVDPEEILSESLYRFNRKKEEIEEIFS